MNKINSFIIGLGLLLLLFSSCKKFLDEKPDKSLSTPSTIADLAGLMESPNTFISDVYAGFGQESCDDYYLTYATWSTLSNPSKKNNYTWTADDLFHNSWNSVYTVIYNANVI